MNTLDPATLIRMIERSSDDLYKPWAMANQQGWGDKSRKPRLSLYEVVFQLTLSMGELCPFAYIITKVVLHTNAASRLDAKTINTTHEINRND